MSGSVHSDEGEDGILGLQTCNIIIQNESSEHQKDNNLGA